MQNIKIDNTVIQKLISFENCGIVLIDLKILFNITINLFYENKLDNSFWEMNIIILKRSAKRKKKTELTKILLLIDSLHFT